MSDETGGGPFCGKLRVLQVVQIDGILLIVKHPHAGSIIIDVAAPISPD